MTDKLTIAYLAIGAHTALREAIEKTQQFKAIVEGGELEFIDKVIGEAQRVDDAFIVYDGRFAGIFCYDIAEPYGEWYAQRIMEQGDVSHITKSEKLKALFEACL